MNAVQLKLGELEIHLELEAIQVTRKVSYSVVLLHLMSRVYFFTTIGPPEHTYVRKKLWIF